MTSTTDTVGRIEMACAPGRAANRYPDWARRTLAGAGGRPVDEGAVHFLAEPPADLPAEVAKWRETGVTRVVCGFLPDEAVWTESGWDADFAWFVAHWEFLPFRFARQVAGRPECVVLAMDSTAGVEPLCEVIAQAWADAAGLKLARLDISRCDEASIASTLIQGALVVNDVQDWALGFAIDELEARLGRPVLRLRQPEYSPLRHALLGQLLPTKEVGGEQSLRALLAEPLAAARKRLLPYGNSAWYAGGSGAQAWQALYGQAAMDAFWRGVNWKTFRLGGAIDGHCLWTNRVVGWAALAAAGRQTGFPVGARDCAGTVLARWIAAELQERVAGPVRDQALPRLVRWSPEWITQYSLATEANPVLRTPLVGWVGRSSGLGSFGEPLLAVVRTATSAVGTEGAKRAGWLLVLAWAEAWDQVAERAKEAGPVSPWLRSLCATVFCARLGECGRSGRGELEQVLLADNDTWSRSFGAAAPVLRAMAEMRAGRVVQAAGVVREWLQRAGIGPMQGMLRLVRAGFPTQEDWVTWLAVAAAQEAGVPWLSLVAVVERWYPRRVPLALPLSRTPQVQQELMAAIVILQAVVGAGNREARVFRTLAVLCAVDGAEEAACSALAGYAAVEPAPGVIAYSVAVLLWYRGAKPAPAELVAKYPETDGDGAYLVYLRALAAQLIGDLPLATRSLQRLARQAPGFFQDERAGDARWLWTAILLRLSGQELAAATLRSRAAAVSGSHGVMIDETPCGAAPLAQGWLDALARVNEAATVTIPERVS